MYTNLAPLCLASSNFGPSSICHRYASPIQRVALHRLQMICPIFQILISALTLSSTKKHPIRGKYVEIRELNCIFCFHETNLGWVGLAMTVVLSQKQASLMHVAITNRQPSACLFLRKRLSCRMHPSKIITSKASFIMSGSSLIVSDFEAQKHITKVNIPAREDLILDYTRHLMSWVLIRVSVCMYDQTIYSAKMTETVRYIQRLLSSPIIETEEATIILNIKNTSD